jgi:YD repeat-containing protein
VTAAVRPAGNVNSYGYDGRGNLQTVTQIPLTVNGSDSTPLVTNANYPSTCTNIITCNKPTWVKDPKGNQTDFTYDPTHGGLLTETDPADATGIRPQKRLTYVPRNAWYLNSSGAMTKDTNAIWVLSSESICRKGAPAASGTGCSLANDEVVTAYDYGPDSGPNNLILRGKTIAADGETLRSCFGHDKQGNKIWETSPNANPSSCPAY